MSLNFNGININGTSGGGGGGGTSNHAQLTNLDYANSGHTGFMSSANYLPDGTTITVASSGGDYTTLEQALAFISDKWSDGAVTISLSAETFTTAGNITIENNRIKQIIIEGQGPASTFIKINYNDTLTSGFSIFVIQNGANVIFKDLKIGTEKTTTPDFFNHNCIWCADNAFVSLDNILLNGMSRLAQARTSATLYLQSNCEFTNAQNSLFMPGGKLIMRFNLTFTFTNIVLAFRITNGGTLQFWGCKLNNTNVTTVSNHSPYSDPFTQDGLALGEFSVL